jgi:hypothetical protein
MLSVTLGACLQLATTACRRPMACSRPVRIAFATPAGEGYLEMGTYALVLDRPPEMCRFNVPYSGASCTGTHLAVVVDSRGVAGVMVKDLSASTNIRLKRENTEVGVVAVNHQPHGECQQRTMVMHILGLPPG